MTRYIHELPDWPKFHWDDSALAASLAFVRNRQGRLVGRMEGLGFDLRSEANLQVLTQDVIKSSEIEGDVLDMAQVRSSIARRLGMDIGPLAPTDRHVEGVVEMMLDATQNYAAPLTEDRLFAWHATLFPTGRSGMERIRVGAWRDDSHGPMRVVSGVAAREKIHFQAPPAKRIKTEMRAFLAWFNGKPAIDPVLASALAHLWFVTIHPFDDGNGRIARAISDMVLARSEGSSQRFYSLSSRIRQERKAYYDILEQTQKGPLDITPWMFWFIACLGHALDGAETSIGNVLAKANFWKNLEGTVLNDRQRLMLNRLLDGFAGKLTSSKWATIAKCSHDTALRDIHTLMELGILEKDASGGRSTSYSLKENHSSNPK